MSDPTPAAASSGVGAAFADAIVDSEADAAARLPDDDLDEIAASVSDQVEGFLVTVREVAERYSQRVARLLPTGTETCRVRTITGGVRPLNARPRAASADSQLSVELWVLTTSARRCANARPSAAMPRSPLAPIGSSTAGTPKRGASARIRAPGAA